MSNAREKRWAALAALLLGTLIVWLIRTDPGTGRRMGGIDGREAAGNGPRGVLNDWQAPRPANPAG